MRLDLDRTKAASITVPASELGRLVADAPVHNVSAFLEGFISVLADRNPSDIKAVAQSVLFLPEAKRKFFLELARSLNVRGSMADLARAIEDKEDD